jgi:hypothetical protein
MEPIILIAGLTALHLALVALMDVLGSKKPRFLKLGWSAVIVGLPLIGAILYYLRADRRPERAARAGRRAPGRERRSSVQEEPAVPVSDAGR